MKIVKLISENFKKIRAVEITPEGAIVQITGPNGSGKSSILDSIYAAIAGAGAVPKQPIRRGETSAKVLLDLGEFVVTRKFTEAGSTLTVEAASGARIKSPQHLMDSLASSISLDPLAFARAEPKEQFDMLRSVVKLDIDLEALAGQNQKDYEVRTETNRIARLNRAAADGIRVPDGLPESMVDLGALMRKMEEAGEHNAGIETRKAKREQGQRDIDALLGSAAKHRAESTRHLDLAAGMDADADKIIKALEAAPPLPEPIVTAAIRQELDTATDVNAGIAKREQRKKAIELAEYREAEAQKLTEAMEARNQVKAEALAAAKMPIPDIALGEGIVMYKGLPFEQASSAEQLRVSAAIAMAGNPKLRVLRIKDGSLLDSNGLQLLREMAEAQDYQVWIEAVGESGKVGIVMEDGAVVAHVEEENQA